MSKFRWRLVEFFLRPQLYWVRFILWPTLNREGWLSRSGYLIGVAKAVEYTDTNSVSDIKTVTEHSVRVSVI